MPWKKPGNDPYQSGMPRKALESGQKMKDIDLELSRDALGNVKGDQEETQKNPRMIQDNRKMIENVLEQSWNFSIPI